MYTHSVNDLSRIATGGLEMAQLKPTSVVSGDSFTGTVDFEWSQASDRFLVGPECFIQMKYEAVLIRVVGKAPPLANEIKTFPLGISSLDEGASPDNTVTFSRNAALSCFNQIRYSLCNRDVDNCQSPAIVDTFNRVTSSSSQLEEKVAQSGQSCPAIPLQRVDVVDGNASFLDSNLVYSTTAGLAYRTYKQDGRYRNAVNGPFQAARQGSVTFRPPVSMFQTQELINGGSTHKLSLSINPQYRQLLINQDGFDTSKLVSVSAANQAANAVANAAAPAVYFYGFDVKDMSLWRAQIRASAPVRIPRSLYALQYNTFAHNLTGSTDQWQVSLPRGTQKIGICFLSAKRGAATSATAQGASTSETDFSVKPDVDYLTNGMQQLQNITVAINGLVYPLTSYQCGPLIANANNSYYDNARAFRDYIIQTSTCDDRSGGVLSYDEWNMQKLHVWQIFTGAELSEQQAELTYTGLSEPTNTTVMLIAYTKLKIDIEMDESRNTEVKSISTVPF